MCSRDLISAHPPTTAGLDWEAIHNSSSSNNSNSNNIFSISSSLYTSQLRPIQFGRSRLRLSEQHTCWTPHLDTGCTRNPDSTTLSVLIYTTIVQKIVIFVLGLTLVELQRLSRLSSRCPLIQQSVMRANYQRLLQHPPLPQHLLMPQHLPPHLHPPPHLPLRLKLGHRHQQWDGDGREGPGPNPQIGV